MPSFSKPRGDLGIELGQLERDDLAGSVLADEGKIDDPDDPSVGEVGECRGDLAPELVAGKRHDHVVDWADLFHRASPLLGYASAFALIASNSDWLMAPLSSRPLAFSISAAAPPLDATVRT